MLDDGVLPSDEEEEPPNQLLFLSVELEEKPEPKEFLLCKPLPSVFDLKREKKP